MTASGPRSRSIFPTSSGPGSTGYPLALTTTSWARGEVGQGQREEVQRRRALRVPGKLRPLPGGEAPVHLLLQAPQPFLELADRVARDRLALGGADLGDPVLQLQDRFLELKLVRHTRR